MLSRIVTRDESWVLHLQPKTKRASMQRKLPVSSVKTFKIPDFRLPPQSMGSASPVIFLAVEG